MIKEHFEHDVTDIWLCICFHTLISLFLEVKLFPGKGFHQIGIWTYKSQLPHGNWCWWNLNSGFNKFCANILSSFTGDICQRNHFCWSRIVTLGYFQLAFLKPSSNELRSYEMKNKYRFITRRENLDFHGSQWFAVIM